MSILAVFNGVTYSIPEKGEVGWFDLSDYLYALSGAATTSSMVYSVTNVSATPYTPVSTDTTILVKLTSPAPSTIALPTGTDGRVLIIADKLGDSETNSITITPSALQTINGTTSYVIRSNFGTAMFQFDTTTSNWVLLSEIKVLDGSETLADTATTTLTFVNNIHGFILSDELGRSLYIASEYLSGTVSCLSDKSNLFLPTDSGVGYYISKTASSNVISIKNRTGGSRDIKIKKL